MHSSDTFMTRIGLYNHVVLVWRLWRRDTVVNRYSNWFD